MVLYPKISAESRTITRNDSQHDTSSINSSPDGVFQTPGSTPTPGDAKNCLLGRDRVEIKNYRHIFWSTTSFKEEIIQMCYEKHRIDGSLLLMKTNLLVMLGMTVNFSYGFLFACLLYSELWVVKTLLLVRVIVLLSFVYLCYRINKIQHSIDFDQQDYHRNVLLTTNITNWTIIGASLVNGAMYVWKSSLSECVDNGDDDFFLYTCNEGYTVGSSAFLSAIVLLVGNTYLIAVFRCHHFLAVMAAYCITSVSCLLAAAVAPHPQQSLLMIIFALLCIFMYINMEMNNFEVFRTLLESEKNKREQGDELKHFIGNVSFNPYACHTRLCLLT